MQVLTLDTRGTASVPEPGRRYGYKKGMNLPSGVSTDEALWRRALDGSTDAWGELFLRHHQAVYNFCFRRTGQWSIAEDLTSAVFLEAWRCRKNTRLVHASALPWLYGIATMLSRNHHRTLRRYQRALERIPPPDQGRDPAELAAARIDAERRVACVRSEIAQLPRRDADLLELAATGRLSHTEIAVALSISVGTVKSRLFRIRQRLGRNDESAR
jgi:RNA polymerase sigma-70 factor (ECF subfamily)